MKKTNFLEVHAYTSRTFKANVLFARAAEKRIVISVRVCKLNQGAEHSAIAQ